MREIWGLYDFRVLPFQGFRLPPGSHFAVAKDVRAIRFPRLAFPGLPRPPLHQSIGQPSNPMRGFARRTRCHGLPAFLLIVFIMPRSPSICWSICGHQTKDKTDKTQQNLVVTTWRLVPILTGLRMAGIGTKPPSLAGFLNDGLRQERTFVRVLDDPVPQNVSGLNERDLAKSKLL